MENIQIFIYSVIQGITEFLPVSSSAHLYLLQDIYNWKDNALLLAIGAHLGSFFAVVVFNRNLFTTFNKDNLLISASIASLPVLILGGLIGLFGYNSFKSNLYIIAFACIVGGILLDISDNNKKKKIKNKITFQQSMIIGVFQILALIPGMSRSGTVITAMRFLGINRKLSITFSLLTGIPVLLAACCFGLFKAINSIDLDLIKLLLIIIISFLSAMITIHFFFKWIKKFSFRIFSIYRILLGVFILSYLI
tara:strand:- start:1777 stop:2529 length:753 start_codon:yes stop_codon:yes gene_type:complete